MANPASAQASEEAAEEQNDNSTIMVTARRQSETLAGVPSAISGLIEEALRAAGIERADDLAQLTPGVTIVIRTAETGDTQINIRGINGARDAESSVALLVDGILKTNTAQLNQQQGPLRQIEILKGLQGALYGRNAAAGAIVIQTAKLGESLEGRVLVSAAEDNTSRANTLRPVTVGNESPYTADYTSNIGMQFDLPVNDTTDFIGRADYRITDPTWFQTVQDHTSPTLFSVLLPGSALTLPAFIGHADYLITQRDKFGMLDVRVGV